MAVAKNNLLTRGQEVMVEVDPSQRKIITLRPGEMSLHHVRLVHGGPPRVALVCIMSLMSVSPIRACEKTAAEISYIRM